MDPGFPESLGPVFQTIFIVDSNHAHDLKTRHYLTGIIGSMISTSVVWMSKRQGSIARSTYAAEFSAFCTETDEA